MDLAPLTAVAASVPVWLLVFVRFASLLVTAPVIGGPFAPMTARALLAAAMALLVAPVVAPHLGPIPTDGRFLILVAQEAVVGLCLGFLMDLVFLGIRMGGELINRHAGFSAAENFDPDSSIGAGPFGDMLYISAVLLFLAGDGHHLIFATLARSYEALPPGAWHPGPALVGLLTTALSDACVAALVLSFPVLGTVLLLTLAEGVMTRAVPQINLMQLSFALKMLVSLFVFSAGLPACVAFIAATLGGVQRLTSAFLMG